MGLGIGQLVFTTLNRIEWVLAGLLLLSQWPSRLSLTTGQRLQIVWLLTMMFIQTVGLLPVLNQRVLLYQHNTPPAPSAVHLYYIGAEVSKLISLIGLGFSTFLTYQTVPSHARYTQSHRH